MRSWQPVRSFAVRLLACQAAREWLRAVRSQANEAFVLGWIVIILAVAVLARAKLLLRRKHTQVGIYINIYIT